MYSIAHFVLSLDAEVEVAVYDNLVGCHWIVVYTHCLCCLSVFKSFPILVDIIWFKLEKPFVSNTIFRLCLSLLSTSWSILRSPIIQHFLFKFDISSILVWSIVKKIIYIIVRLHLQSHWLLHRSIEQYSLAWIFLCSFCLCRKS